MIVPVNPKLITLGPGVESRSSFCQPSPTSENEAWTRSLTKPPAAGGRLCGALPMIDYYVRRAPYYDAMRPASLRSHHVHPPLIFPGHLRRAPHASIESGGLVLGSATSPDRRHEALWPVTSVSAIVLGAIVRLTLM